MPDAVISNDLLDALRSGGEALDRGERGPMLELALIRETGLLSAPLSIDVGGRGWGTDPTGSDAICDVLMALGGASLPIARLYEGHVNAVALIHRHAGRPLYAQLSAAIRGGAVLGVWGADSERPVSIEEGIDGATLRGTKAFASGLGDLAYAIVTARAPGGMQMVVVAADDPQRADPAAWDVDGMVGSRSGRFDCSGLPATPADCVGAPDALFREPDFHGGVWRLAACYAGAMARLAVMCDEWLDRRGRSGEPLMLARLGMVAIEAETSMLWARHAGSTVERGTVAAEVAVCAALFARDAVDQAATRQLAIVERLVGTAMHRRGSEIGRLARDLRFYLRQADLDGKLALATGHWRHRAV